MNLLFVGIGGFLGAVARYGTSLWIGQRWGRELPVGTFAVNIIGSLLIGLLMPLLTERFIINPQWRMLLIIGFLGSYTTFSTFAYETGALLNDGEWFYAGLNVCSSILVGFIALKSGEIISRLF